MEDRQGLVLVVELRVQNELVVVARHFLWKGVERWFGDGAGVKLLVDARRKGESAMVDHLLGDESIGRLDA